MASRNDFSRQCREWASSLDNAILRLNFKSKRGDDEDGRRPICCDRCGASGRVRFSIRRTTEAPPNAKDAANLKVDRKRRRRKGGRRKTHDERGAKKALLGRCEVCSRVVETLEMKARTRSSAASASTTAAPKSPLGDIQGEKGTSNVASAIEDSCGKKNKKKKKKGQRDKEEFAGLNLSKKSASPSLSSSQPLKAGDKKLLQMLRKDPAVAASSDDRLSAFLRK